MRVQQMTEEFGNSKWIAKGSFAGTTTMALVFFSVQLTCFELENWWDGWLEEVSRLPKA